MSTSTSDAPVLPGLNYVRPLGRGGYAEVFLYEQTNPRMRVAVKVLFAESLSPRAMERFATEANTMAELADHPNIVQVFRSDVTDDGRPYLVMKYYPQRNLAARAKTERLSVPEVLEIGVRVACAVETAHRAGILHRDIKPANILTSQYGEPGLTDFGIATSGVEQEADVEGLSIPWSPPEVVFGTGIGDRTADVYSLGATLWHLLVGHSPFESPGTDASSIAVMRRIREMPPPRTGRDDVLPSLERLLAHAMAKSPADRPQTALQLARSLQAIESEQRWAPTPLVLLEAGDDGEVLEVDDPAGRTSGGGTVERSGLAYSPGTPTPRSEAGVEGPGEDPPTRRRPVTVAPQAETAAAPRGSIAAAERPGNPSGQRIREGMPHLVDEPGTVRRPAAVAAEPPAVAGTEEATTGEPRRSRTLVTGVVVTGVVALVVIAILLVSRGSTGPSTTTTALSSPPPTIATDQSPNQPTGLTATRVDAGNVRFTWIVPGQQPGDVVEWSRSSDGPWQTTSTDAVNVLSTGEVCIYVVVQSASGAQSTPASQCGG